VTPSATSENNSGVVRLIANPSVLCRFLRFLSTESVGIELGCAVVKVQGYQSRPFGCEVGSQFHQRHVPRGPPIMPYGRISRVRFEALAFRL
jgi:hypothetical protein